MEVGILSRLSARKQEKRKGAALVEAAIVLPVIILLIGIIVDYSRIFYALVTLDGSVRNGALYEFDPINVNQSRYTDYVTASQADITDLKSDVTYAKSESSPGTGVTHVTVTANTTFNTISSWLLLPPEKNVSRTIVIRKAPLIPD